MTTTNYGYGKFAWDGANTNGVVKVTILDDDSPKKQVIKAIRFAKAHRCRISRRVEYNPETGHPTTTFEVMCNHKTDKVLYPYGTSYQSLANSRIEIADIKAYKKKFHTDRSVQPGFKKRFWYVDKFTGLVQSFPTLSKAVQMAKKEIGSVVAIWTNFPYGEEPRIKCYANASGMVMA